MKKEILHPNEGVFTVSELQEVLSSCHEDAVVAMCFNGAENNTRTISSVFITTKSNWLEYDLEDEAVDPESDRQVVVLFSDRIGL